MKDRPLTPIHVAQIAYGALWACRAVAGTRIKPWEMLQDDQKIWFAHAIAREEEPGAQIPGLSPISERDEAVIAAIRGALAGK